MRILDLKDPGQLKTLSIPQLESLAQEIRSFLIQSLSKTGGHLSSNLGIVELTLALHYVFESPKDRLLFDVGHQSYVHKILTGRAPRFATLRQRHGLSGFQKREESPHDPWEAGHSSTSLSAALGLAVARDLQKESGEVISVIGDGALTGGMAMEALNNIGMRKEKVIIVYNDNDMSISPNHAGFKNHLTTLRSSRAYRSVKRDVKAGLEPSPALLNGLSSIRDVLRDSLVDGGLFQQFGLDYLGPVDGHNLPELIRTLETAREHHGSVVVHVRTRKGMGYGPAQQDRTGQWHGVPPFDPATGRFRSSGCAGEESWSLIIADAVSRLAAKDPRITVLTPAMANGSKLLQFAAKYPDRFFDCGIAEEHTVTAAGGMAAGGLRPFVSIYSSFLQRAYDQVLHDVARQHLPVVFGVDRAGLVGEDGDTHQGIYDIAFLRTIPDVVICQPKDAQEAQDLVYSAFLHSDPCFIRYPRGTTAAKRKEVLEEIQTGTWTWFDEGTPEQIVITYGPEVDRVREKAKVNGTGLRVVNARFFKPVDEAMIRELFAMGLPVTVFETDVSQGGLSSAIRDCLAKSGDPVPAFHVIGLPDAFIPHGSVRALRKEEGISLEDLFDWIERKSGTDNRQAEGTRRVDAGVRPSSGEPGPSSGNGSLS